MKATFDILRRWSYPLVPEIISLLNKQSLSKATNPTSPQIKSSDLNLSFYNTFHPIIYDKHNIYKQGDVQLDRLSNIQQDVFIGHKSQISSGVCLRSSLIGQNCIIGKNTKIENSIIWNNVQIAENCIIKDAIICDNVLIRNDVKIDKECILCKNVIIGTNIHLNPHTIIVASNSTTSTAIIDDVEIDDEVQKPSKTSKRSNSKQRSSSIRLSEKSFSEKSLSSSTEEPIISNSDLVGTDGLGKELVFTSVSDEQTKTFDPIDDDDDDDDNNNLKNQLHAIDAWGCHIDRKQNKDLTDEESEGENAAKPPRFAKPKSPSDQSSDVPSEDEISDSDGDEVSSEEESSDHDHHDNEFQEEVIRTLERAYTQKLNVENIIVELNMLKPTYDVSPTEFDQSITRAVFLLPFEKKIANPEKSNYWNTLKSTMDQTTKPILKNYMKKTNEQSQMTLLNEFDSICLKHIQPIGERIVQILSYLYDNDVLDEQWILQFYEKKQEKLNSNQSTIKLEEKLYYDKMKQFVEWLQNAESEDEDDDEDEDTN